MNQDNKISSVRPGTISIELFDNYRGLRSVDDIYRVQSAHAENNHERGVHYKKTLSLVSNYAFHFHTALNFRLCTFKMLQLLETPSPDPLPGLRSWIPLGDFRPPGSLALPNSTF